MYVVYTGLGSRVTIVMGVRRLRRLYSNFYINSFKPLDNSRGLLYNISGFDEILKFFGGVLHMPSYFYPSFCLEVVEKDGSSHYYSSVHSFSIYDVSDPSDRTLEFTFFSGTEYEQKFSLKSISRIRLNPFSEKPVYLFYDDTRMI